MGVRGVQHPTHTHFFGLLWIKAELLPLKYDTYLNFQAT